MATSQIDRLSALPDEVLITVLSLLPTRITASTSVLSRRFRHLWKASPSVDFSIKYGTYIKNSTYVAMANSALLSRTPSNPLLRLHLDNGSPLTSKVTESFICSLLIHAHALGLRHLIADNYCFSEPVVRAVFSISSLESLSILIIPQMTLPSTIAFTRLRRLSFNLSKHNSTQFQGLLSKLCCLEDLQIGMFSGVVFLSSQTIKKLELLFCLLHPERYSLGLSMPSLEFLHLKSCGTFENVPHIHGEIPFIRKAVVTLYNLRQKHVTSVAQLLKFISHVEELSLDLHEHWLEDYPFPIFLEPRKEVPTFPNLKHLDMSICFHEYNFKAMVAMLHHSTALESLKLHHKSSDFWIERRKINAWRSNLPRNRDGNYQYASFENIHLGENTKEFKKLLYKKCTPKRQRVGS